MKYLFLGLLPLCQAFRLHSNPLTRQPLHLIKNTPYGPLEGAPLSDIYKGLDQDSITGIYFSEDLKNIYVVETPEKAPSKIVNSNPLLTEQLIVSAREHKITTSVLEPVNNLFDKGGQLLTGFLDLSVMLIGLSIVYNLVINLFFQGFQGKGSSGNKNGMGPSPFNLMKKSKAQVDQTAIKTRLSDWAGSPEVLEECSEIVSYFRNSTLYDAVGAELPKGILLEGPPGTGKTLLAKAIAGETNSTFLSMSGSEFVELFVGMGALKVRQLFQEAREKAPSIIFIDEIDAVGKKRSVSNAANTNDEREQTLNQILSEMDGFQPNKGVIVLAATNRRDVLDDALLRPGRFDRLIYVPLPDRSSREAILSLYMSNKNISVPVGDLAEATNGFSGAQLKNLLNEAAILAARGGSTFVTKDNIDGALEKLVVGITKRVDGRTLSTRVRVAIHELGHALMAASYPDVFDLKKVSMKQTYEGVGGYTLFGEIQDDGLYTKEIMMSRIVVALGGKAAEALMYGEQGVSVGASQDLKQANELARAMVEQYGMGAGLEAFSLIPGRSSEKTRETVDEAVSDIVEYALVQANKRLTELQGVRNRLLFKLLRDGVLEGSAIIAAM
jgi:cell division protease FtsH